MKHECSWELAGFFTTSSWKEDYPLFKCEGCGDKVRINTYDSRQLERIIGSIAILMVWFPEEPIKLRMYPETI